MVLQRSLILARALNTIFRAHRSIYELSDGRIGTTDRYPMLLLSVSGRKTGQIRTTPLVYFEDGDRYVVVGSDVLRVRWGGSGCATGFVANLSATQVGVGN